MRQVNARLARRDLRRAVGADALATIGELQTNIERTANSVADAHARLGEHKKDGNGYHARINALEEWCLTQETDYAADLAWLQLMRRRTFWGRLKLLVRGR